MKMRKLFAGIAAAATLLGGMALGTVSAQADDAATTPLLQVNNAQEGHTYTPYRFATFENAGNGTVEVSTVEAWKDAVTAAADTANGNDSIPAEYKNNPAAYVATFNEEQIREFATELAKTNPLPTVDGAGLTVTAEQAGTTQPVAVSGEGWYLGTDTFTESGETTATTGTPAVVATTVNGLTDLTIVPDKVTGQGNITTVGQFNAKNENPLTPPAKTAKVGNVDVDGKTVNVGDTVNFTVSATVPASAANYDVYPFTITDTASKGLKVAAANTFKVQVDGRDVDSSLYTVTQTGAATEAAGTTTIIKFANARTLDGKTIVVSYTGTVTKVSVAGTSTGSATTYPVTIRIDETDGLLPGMSVDATIELQHADNVLVIPAAALNRGNTVLVTKDSPSAANAQTAQPSDSQPSGDQPDGSQPQAPDTANSDYVSVQVTTGVSDGDYIEITSGLQEGDTVAYIQTSSSGGMDMMMGGMPGGDMPGGSGMPGGGGPGGGGGGAPGGF